MKVVAVVGSGDTTTTIIIITTNQINVSPIRGSLHPVGFPTGFNIGTPVYFECFCCVFVVFMCEALVFIFCIDGLVKH